MTRVIGITATCHKSTEDGYEQHRVMLDRPPVARVSLVESIMVGWWRRSGGYPVGRVFGTAVGVGACRP